MPASAASASSKSMFPQAQALGMSSAKSARHAARAPSAQPTVKSEVSQNIASESIQSAPSDKSRQSLKAKVLSVANKFISLFLLQQNKTKNTRIQVKLINMPASAASASSKSMFPQAQALGMSSAKSARHAARASSAQPTVKSEVSQNIASESIQSAPSDKGRQSLKAKVLSVANKFM
ncbi:hypothetical protein HDU81_004074 [Chytriomyces hyalinus]|nr:hypothetical protein HDU81_004074 [Chytriomyces hyalinus]